MTKIKICGITNSDDAVAAVRAGADMLGFVFFKGSKRYVEPSIAGKISSMLPPHVARVGVFVDEDADNVLKIAKTAGLDMLQFHGGESPAYCRGFDAAYQLIKAFCVKDGRDLLSIGRYDCGYHLFDAYAPNVPGGSGRTFEWNILQNIVLSRPIFLSGGLNPENVVSAIKLLHPYGVDVSSSVEMAPGKKDAGRMADFVAQVRKAD